MPIRHRNASAKAVCNLGPLYSQSMTVQTCSSAAQEAAAGEVSLTDLYVYFVRGQNLFIYRPTAFKGSSSKQHEANLLTYVYIQVVGWQYMLLAAGILCSIEDQSEDGPNSYEEAI